MQLHVISLWFDPKWNRISCPYGNCSTEHSTIITGIHIALYELQHSWQHINIYSPKNNLFRKTSMIQHSYYGNTYTRIQAVLHNTTQWNQRQSGRWTTQLQKIPLCYWRIFGNWVALWSALKMSTRSWSCLRLQSSRTFLRLQINWPT